MAWFCEECCSEVSIEQKEKSERQYIGHVYCEKCLKKEFHRSIANEVSGDRWSEKQQ